MKVAIVHYWLVNYRGGERVVEALCRLFPEADIHTLVYNPERMPDAIRRHSVRTSFLQKLPRASRRYQPYLPLFPVAIEQFDLRSYDLVISSEASVAKGVLTRPETLHVCYCHSPMRYAWDLYHDYLGRDDVGPFKRRLIPLLMNWLRVWDVAASHRVDRFVANSENVRRRILKHYRREAEVIFPPVPVDDYEITEERGDYYLSVGQLVPYKRVDLLVRAMNALGRRLVVIGDGPQLRTIRRLAGPTVTVMGWQPFPVVRRHLARARAFLFPGEEDFGMAPVESLASGRPVLALARGGALEVVREGATGLHIAEPTVEAISDAVLRFEAGGDPFDPAALRAHARQFDAPVFDRRMRDFIDTALREHRQAMKL
jgi:glycosyltransferase involved in cell wall biosynthesis